VLAELLQLYAIAIFGVGFSIKNIPAMEIVTAIIQITLLIDFQRARMDKNTLENYTEKSSITPLANYFTYDEIRLEC
jgi:hypothetical protein